MNSDNKNLILAVTVSMLILIGTQWYFTPPPPTPEQITAQNAATQVAPSGSHVPSLYTEDIASKRADLE